MAAAKTGFPLLHCSQQRADCLCTYVTRRLMSTSLASRRKAIKAVANDTVVDYLCAKSTQNARRDASDARMCKMMSEDAQRCENLTRRCAKLTQRCANCDVEMRGCDESVPRQEKLCQIVLPRSNRRKNRCQFM